MDDALLTPTVPFRSRKGGQIVASGRLSYEKGFDTLIRAFALLDSSLNARLVILGDGPARGELEELISSLGLKNSISMPGAKENVQAALDECALFAMASHHEGFPNALAEAMARGCPSVVADCDFGPADMLKNNGGGILVPVGKERELAEALQRVLKDERLAERLGVAARARAETWRINHVADQWLV
jgi:glycosyltransferase involved in cell wall biosynthesis